MYSSQNVCCYQGQTCDGVSRTAWRFIKNRHHCKEHNVSRYVHTPGARWKRGTNSYQQGRMRETQRMIVGLEEPWDKNAKDQSCCR